MNQTLEPAVRTIARKMVGQPTSDGAGVRMTRVIGTSSLDHFDPFLLLDEFRSDDPDDYIAGFPEHPHRGFETVTYMLAGMMQHRDNQGNSGLLKPGSVQWMTAGRGIVHSEMPRQQDGLMWGFQLWVNLPARDKMRAPRYQEFAADGIPSVDLAANTRVHVIAGSLLGVSGPIVDIPTEPFYYDVRVSPGADDVRLATPATHNTFVYVYDGEVQLPGDGSGLESVRRGEIALLNKGEELRASVSGEARFLVIGGRPLDEPVARYGPFVMNTADELRQAVTDYQAGRL